MSKRFTSVDDRIRVSRRINEALIFLAILIGIGLLVTVVYRLPQPDFWSFLASISIPAVTGGASLMVGGGLGFLFGIPRTLQSDIVDNNRETTYRANTNLEQISDWLTKILVGVGLTQLSSLPDGLSRLTAFIAQGMDDQTAHQPFALGILLYFGACGFLYGYLWTRLYLAGAMRDAEELNEQFAKDQINSQALSYVRERLSTDAPTHSEEVLTKTIKAASPDVREAIFNMAYKVRRENWSDTPNVMERTIPVFKALTEADSNNMEYFGNLGYALKDKRRADWAGALQALNTAIELRGKFEARGWAVYEFNRALCLINLDAAFRDGKPSAPDQTKDIVTDLQVGLNEGGYIASIITGSETIARWAKLNQIKLDNLVKAAP